MTMVISIFTFVKAARMFRDFVTDTKCKKSRQLNMLQRSIKKNVIANNLKAYTATSVKG